ncbi:MAG TPA: YbaB/EbfC family nucleoid-associated protein [Planctomycetaceae bacterium]|jgi:DNA-binding YbaB/EbfC family protein|nr:YbaB/EbfC family nucleoid-associated protein [Planctomycetaceae bacterium]
MFKGLTNFAAILKEAQQIQGRAEEMQAKLGQLRVEGSAGGKMVMVQASGLQRVLAIKIEPSLLEGADAEMLEDLLVSATNQALEKAAQAAADEMAKMTSQLQLPGLTEMMSKLGLGGSNGSDPTA